MPDLFRETEGRIATWTSSAVRESGQLRGLAVTSWRQRRCARLPPSQRAACTNPGHGLVRVFSGQDRTGCDGVDGRCARTGFPDPRQTMASAEPQNGGALNCVRCSIARPRLEQGARRQIKGIVYRIPAKSSARPDRWLVG